MVRLYQPGNPVLCFLFANDLKNEVFERFRLIFKQ